MSESRTPERARDNVAGAVPLGMLRDEGERWQIQQVQNTALWIAIARPVLHLARFYVTGHVEHLRDLLDNDRAHRR